MQKGLYLINAVRRMESTFSCSQLFHLSGVSGTVSPLQFLTAWTVLKARFHREQSSNTCIIVKKIKVEDECGLGMILFIQHLHDTLVPSLDCQFQRVVASPVHQVFRFICHKIIVV